MRKRTRELENVGAIVVLHCVKSSPLRYAQFQCTKGVFAFRLVTHGTFARDSLNANCVAVGKSVINNYDRR